MAQHTVTIFLDTISPSSLSVQQGDSVQFVLKRPDVVTVEFVSSAGTPFSQSSIPLDGSSSLTAQSAQTILSNASGSYGFKAVPADRDPPGTLAGDIDVTPDW